MIEILVVKKSPSDVLFAVKNHPRPPSSSVFWIDVCSLSCFLWGIREKLGDLLRKVVRCVGKAELPRWIYLWCFVLGHLPASNLFTEASSCFTFNASPRQLTNFLGGFTQFFAGMNMLVDAAQQLWGFISSISAEKVFVREYKSGSHAFLMWKLPPFPYFLKLNWRYNEPAIVFPHEAILVILVVIKGW